MIAKLIFGTSLAGSLYYNENKVKEKSAIQIGEANIAVPCNSTIDKINLLEHYAEKNKNVKNNSTHIILSFTETDKNSGQDFMKIANDYLKQLGFENQPAIFYSHTDTVNPHIHIVTTPVQENGNKINSDHIFRKSNSIRKSIEKKYNLSIAEDSKKSNTINEESKYTKQKMQSIIKTTLNYKFQDFNSFSEYLKLKDISVIKKEYINKEKQTKIGLLYKIGEKKPIKASNLYFKPTIENVTKNLDSTLESKYATIIKNQISNKTLTYYLQSNDIEILKFTNNFYLKDNKNKYIIDYSKIGTSTTYLEDYINIISKPSDFKKDINVKISNFYQNYKKRNDIYFESNLILNFPNEQIINHLVGFHNIDKTISENAVSQFEAYKLSKLKELQLKENEYFKYQTNKIIDFLDKLSLNRNDKFKLLSYFEVGVIEEQNLIYHKKDFGNNFFRKINFKNSVATSLQLDNINSETIKLLKKLALSENHKTIYIDGKIINQPILLILQNQGVIQSNGDLYAINEHYISLLDLKQVEFENEKFLNQNHKNYTKKLRGF